MQLICTVYSYLECIAFQTTDHSMVVVKFAYQPSQVKNRRAHSQVAEIQICHDFDGKIDIVKLRILQVQG